MNVQDINFNEYDMYDLSKAAEAAMLDFKKTGKTIIFDEQIFRITC